MDGINSVDANVLSVLDVPPLIDKQHFSLITGISGKELKSLIENGTIKVSKGMIPAHEYYKFVLAKNAKDAGVDDRYIKHISESV